MRLLQAECIINDQAQLGEGPVWDDRLKELFWVDIEGSKLHRFRPADGGRRTYELGQKIGAAVPSEGGGWIVALQDGLYRLDLESGSTGLVAASPEAALNNRFNDGKCDAAGRLWIGTISGKWQADGTLYVLDRGQLTARVPGVVCSNGLAWSIDNKTLYYIDSGEKTVNAFDYDAASGEISNRRIVIDASTQDEGGPDGMCIDEEGMLWIGHWGGWQVARWNPLTGEKIAKIEIPVANVTSCAFGGDNMDELYITTARAGNDEQALEGQPLAGGVFRAKPGVRGFAVDRAQ